MILVDTSVWVNHFRSGSKRLLELLADGDVMCHPLVIGELACGNLKNRTEILTLMQSLPQAMQASLEEVLALIDRKALSGKGVGFIDVHLLASALLGRIPLWTDDNRLKLLAQQLGVAN